MSEENYIDVTGVDLKTFIKEVYNLSEPVGMGFLHYREGELDLESVDVIIDHYKDDDRIAVGMDYVHGRCCKMNIWRDGDKLKINKEWYDHTPQQLAELLSKCGITL